MKNALVALAVSFALGFAVSTAAAPQPEAPKCKAAGQPCDSAADCCSRMCRKDTKKCS